MSSHHHGYTLADPSTPKHPRSLPKTPPPLLETYPVGDSPRAGKPWRPWTLTAKVLVPTALFTALLIVALALLQRQNARNGALFFAQTEDGFSHTELFLYRYLPTIIIILYGIIWSWIDLDVKRLEPWFQMADSRGANGASSLLLQYPVQFLPLVPFKAASKKQWVVASTSTILLIVVWGVTPLQNGIFSTSVINLTTAVEVRTTNGLVPLADQVVGLSGSFMMSGYGLAWLGQQPPAFTTSSYALAPFQNWQAIAGSLPAAQNQTITAPTTMYQTSLDCAPPVNISSSDFYGDLRAAFDDGKGCATDPFVPFPNRVSNDESAIWAPHYIGYWTDLVYGRSLEDPGGCPPTSNHTFLAVWAKNTNSMPRFNTASEASALFCTPSYHVQPVNATIALPDLSVLSVVPLGPKSALSEELFNVTQFEYLLGVGIAPDTYASVVGPQRDPLRFTDVSNTKIINQDTKLHELKVMAPSDIVIGYAVGLSDRKLEKLTDPNELHRAFERAHQLLFALAVHDLMPDNEISSVGAGVVNSTLQAVRLVPVFALLSQALLMVILFFTCYLLWSSPRRRNCLSTDPNSLAEIMCMGDDPKVQKILYQCDIATDQGLARAIGTKRFHVEPNVAGVRSKLRIGEEADFPARQDRAALEQEPDRRKLVRPFEYSWLLGLPFILSLAAMIAGLYVVRRMGLLEGLPLPSGNPVVQNLLTNALPALLATLLEPFWILLNRVACIMRPMEELRKGRAPARKSLLLKYNSIPPQLNIWRALRARHFLLAILSFIALLANMLTVAFSGLFSQNAVFHGQDASLKSTLLPRIIPDLDIEQRLSLQTAIASVDDADANLVALSNFSGGATLQPWVSPHYYFLPLEIDQSEGSSSRRYSMQTTGYGAELDCRDMTTSDSDKMIDFGFNSTATSAKIHTSHEQEDGSVIRCIALGSSDDNVSLSGFPVGRKGFEFAGSMLNDLSWRPWSKPPNEAVDSFCPNIVVKGWVRADLRMEARSEPLNSSWTSLSPVTVDNVQSTFITCRPRLKSSKFNLTVSPIGTVLDATQIGNAIYDDPATNLLYLLHETVDLVAGGSMGGWHNDTIASDFPSQMIKALTNSTSFLDPDLPPPDFDAASTVLNDLFARLFAVQMSLRSAILIPALPDAPPISAQLEVFETRIFMSEAMFQIAMAILSIDLLVAIIFYARAPPAFLPRRPTSIGSQLAFFAASHVLDDVREAGGDLKDLDQKGYRYGYGSYVGTDGRTHVGVERVPFVTGLDVTRTGVALRERWNLRFWDRRKRERVPSTDDGG